jgi:hypothetical protein
MRQAVAEKGSGKRLIDQSAGFIDFGQRQEGDANIRGRRPIDVIDEFSKTVF